MKEKRSKALGSRTWLALLVFGLIGQVAWTIENMYFNVFLYNTITGDTGMIAVMVAASAVVATVTTLFAGALSDRLGRRKPIIVAGYLLWGLSVMAFLNMTRVMRASVLLKEDKLTVAQVGKAVGFGSVAHFTDVFKRLEGVTPNEYRRQHQNPWEKVSATSQEY